MSIAMFLKKLQYRLTSKRAQKRMLLEQICWSEESTYHEFERALFYLYEGDFQNAMEAMRRSIIACIKKDYVSVSGRAEHKRSGWRMTEKLVAETTVRITRSPCSSEENKTLLHCLNALGNLTQGMLDYAGNSIRTLCADQPTIPNRCLQGSFLDTTALLDDTYNAMADEHWERLVHDIMSSDELESRFTCLPESKTSVLELDNTEVGRNMLIVKRSPNRADMEQEFNVTNYVHDTMSHCLTVPKPLALVEHAKQSYFAQKRVPGYTIDNIIAASQDRRRLLEGFLETLDKYQSEACRNKSMTSRYGFTMPQTDYGYLFNTKFIERAERTIHKLSPDHQSWYKLKDFFNEDLQTLVEILSKQRQGVIHGDLNCRNIIVYKEKEYCIIDPEKLSLGARILDWANILLHLEIERDISIKGSADMGYDVFRQRNMSREEYAVAYNTAVVFKAAHMAGSAMKYTMAGALDHKTGYERAAKYIKKAYDASLTLEQLLEKTALFFHMYMAFQDVGATLSIHAECEPEIRRMFISNPEKYPGLI